MQPLLREGERARKRLLYQEAKEKGLKTPYKKRHRKTLRWADTLGGDMAGFAVENGGGESDSLDDDDYDYEDVDFELEPEEDELRDILRRRSSTPDPVRIL